MIFEEEYTKKDLFEPWKFNDRNQNSLGSSKIFLEARNFSSLDKIWFISK